MAKRNPNRSRGTVRLKDMVVGGGFGFSGIGGGGSGFSTGGSSTPPSGGGTGFGGGNPRAWMEPTRDPSFDPMRNFRFRVSIQPYKDGVGGWPVNPFDATIGFTSITGMSLTMTSIPLQEGGINTLTHQLPGLASFSPITFQKGIFLGDNENWEWLRRLMGTVGNAGYGSPGGNFRCKMRIDVLSHPNPGSRATGSGGSPKKRDGYNDGWPEGVVANNDHASLSFLLSKAWITTLSYSDLNAGDNALLVEQMTVVHEGMHLDWAGGWGPKQSADAFQNYDTPENRD